MSNYIVLYYVRDLYWLRHAFFTAVLVILEASDMAFMSAAHI